MNNSGEHTQAMSFATEEHSGSEPETSSSTRSSTPLLSDESNSDVHESEREDETGNDNDPSPSGRCDEQDNDNDNSPVQVFNGDSITTAEVGHHPIPPTKPTASVAVVNPPINAIIDENRRRPKRAIKPRVQADQATMDYNDCANSDCDDPKRPGDMIMCAGSGCQTKVCTTRLQTFLMASDLHGGLLVSSHLPACPNRRRKLVL